MRFGVPGLVYDYNTVLEMSFHLCRILSLEEAIHKSLDLISCFWVRIAIKKSVLFFRKNFYPASILGKWRESVWPVFLAGKNWPRALLEVSMQQLRKTI